MILCCKLCDEFVNGFQAHIDPWREVAYNTHPEVLKNEMKHDVLRPRRAAFVRCRNDDIANPFRDMVPARAVQHEILVNVLGVGCLLFQFSQSPVAGFVSRKNCLSLQFKDAKSTVSDFGRGIALRNASSSRAMPAPRTGSATRLPPPQPSATATPSPTPALLCLLPPECLFQKRTCHKKSFAATPQLTLSQILSPEALAPHLLTLRKLS